MNCIIRPCGSYRVIIIRDELTITTDIAPLKEFVQESLAGGIRNIAIRFSPGSLLFTRAGVTLIRCWSLITDHHGSLTFIAPNPHIQEFLELICLKGLTRIVWSEKDLLKNQLEAA